MSGSQVYIPRARLTLNNAPLQGVEQVSYTAASALQVGRFSFSKVIVPGDAFPLAWWQNTASKDMVVAIDIAVDGVSFQQVFTGTVDSHADAPVTGTIQASGRDQASVFMDTRTLSTYRNLTSSQIVQQLAASQGLSANVTATKTLVGRYYQTDHDSITAGGLFAQPINQWDLMTRLASEEGYLLYMDGGTVSFNPPPANPPIFDVICTINADGQQVWNVENPQFSRNLTQARDVIVTVLSWNSRHKKTYKEVARTKTKTLATDPQSKPTKYTITAPNLTPDQALALAQRRARDISTHERYFSFDLPTLVPLTPVHVIRVSGTGTDADMTYYPQTITMNLSSTAAGGSVQSNFSSSLLLVDDQSNEVYQDQG